MAPYIPVFLVFPLPISLMIKPVWLYPRADLVLAWAAYMAN
jgi:hypothetical protein